MQTDDFLASNGTGERSRTSLELLYHISREIASTLDLPTVLQRVLLLSMRNLDAHSGSIFALDDSGSLLSSAIIHETQIVEQLPEALEMLLEQGLAGWVMRHRQAVLIPDTSQDKRWLHRPASGHDQSKSVVSVPLVAREKIIGVITLAHIQPNHFNLEHLELIQAIANQASIAVMNACLYAESQHQARVMTALAESATAITASLDPDKVLQQILEQSRQALQVEAVSLALIDSQRKYIEYKASTSEKDHNVTGIRLKLEQGIAGWVAQEGRGVVVPNAAEDPRFYAKIDQRTGFQTRAIACAPIRLQGEVIGILEAINPLKEHFDADALLVLTGIGSLAGSAIRHAQQFAALAAAHQRYRDLFADNLNSILVTNGQGLILEANREAIHLSGYDRETLTHLSIEQLHKTDSDLLGSGFKVLETGKTITYESVLHTQSGAKIPVEVRVHLILADETPTLQWVFRDISERKKLDQMRDDLLSSIYHDLRSPLSNVISSLDVLESMLSLNAENPAIQSLFKIAVRSTERIQRLTASLLDINRLEAGQPIVNLKQAHPQQLIQDALDAVSPIAHNKSQKIITEISGDLPPVMIDSNMIRRVLINLIENAVKFTPQKGLIRIGAALEDQHVQMWVEDTGPGIPQENRESIFDKYTRLHGSGGPAGFGLGLSYCRLAVEGHGGRIWIEEAAKSGARFVFTLPLKQNNDFKNQG
ncbi:MAG TPA: GAF domain-containing protein [Anaerolineales bacterium]|nr:GAF domain-containing protein [Anaerolineales bacterium]